MKRIFITKATGYPGQNLALHLAEQGYIIHALVRDLSKGGILLDHKLYPGNKKTLSWLKGEN